jgi:hypothetical protein
VTLSAGALLQLSEEGQPSRHVAVEGTTIRYSRHANRIVTNRSTDPREIFPCSSTAFGPREMERAGTTENAPVVAQSPQQYYL